MDLANPINLLKPLNYTVEKGRRDLVAGLTVAAISLPHGMTYALIAGVDPRFGLYSAVVVTLVVAVAWLLLAPLTSYIPQASLAGLLLVTAFRLIDFERIRYALRASRYDAGFVLVTALWALVMGVEFAILVGVAESILLFVPRAAKLKATELFVSPERVVRERLPSDPQRTPVAALDLEGELFFGAALELDRHFETINERVRGRAIHHVVLRLKRVRNPDVVCI